MAIVGMKRVLLCALALGLVLPGVASAAIDLTVAPATNVANLSWTQGDGVGPYTVYRDAGACTGMPTTPLQPAIPLVVPPTTYSDTPAPADATYCYGVDDDALSNVDFATVIIDNAVPSLAATLPADNTFVHGVVSVPYSASDGGSGLSSVALQIDAPGAPVSWASIDSGPSPLSWTTSGDGTYGLRVVATDAAGNVAIDSVTPTGVRVDNSAPSLSPTFPADNSFVSGIVSIPYSASDNGGSGLDTIELHVDAPGAPVSWAMVDSGSSPLAWNSATGDGTYGVRVVAVDNLGNVAVESVTPTGLRVDNTAPALTPTLPADNTFVRGTVSVPYIASDGGSGVTTVAVQVDAPGGPVSWATVDSGPSPLAWNTATGDGTYGVRVVATDGQGNATIVAVTPTGLRVDNTLPAVPVFTGSPANNATIGVGEMVIPYSGGTDANFLNVRVETQTELQVTGDQWTARSPAVSSPVRWTPLAADDCTCNFRLVATDLAGNTRVSLLRTNITIDNFVPLPPALFRIDRAVTNGPPILTWTASPSGDIVGYKLVRDSVHLQGGGGLLAPQILTYTDLDLARDGSADGPHGYQLYANDGGNDSPVKQVSFFLDSMAPTPPTAAKATRRAGQRLVDLSWGASADTFASNGASPTGMSRYVVRRAVGTVPPSTVTSGAPACNVPDEDRTCVDTTAAEGQTYRYAVFAVDAAGNGSAAAAPPAVVIPDLTAPGVPPGFTVRPKGLTIAMTWRLPTAKDLLRIVVVRNATRAPRNVKDGTVVYNGKAAKASVKQLGGKTAYYRAFALDKAGNASATAAVRIRQPVFKLFPENGSELRGTVRLTWKKPKRATYFNVQLYLGSKRVTQSWPKNGSFKIARSKLKKGKTYTWYVWPGVGKKSAGRYGTLIGKSTFTYLG